MCRFSIFCLVALRLCVSTVECEEVSVGRKLRLPSEPFQYEDASPLPSSGTSPVKLRQGQTEIRIKEAYDNTPVDNPITNDGATLGRVLFYDPKMSVNGTTSCASCHQQKHAFTDPRKLSLGFDGRKVSRNSMSLVNVRYYPSGKMFWDERAKSLEEQVLMPIENSIEMGHQLNKLVLQLSDDPIYPPLFENAFGDKQISAKRIARALAQFVRSIVSFRSRYDEGRVQVESVLDAFPNFTEEENYGKQHFFGRGKCASCHLEDPDAAAGGDEGGILPNRERQSLFFYMREAAVNGIDSDEADDGGVAEITGRKEDIGRFKVPSLRNIEVTGPYMHDGRFQLIEQVLEHYNWSVRPHPNLDSRLKSAVAGIALPEREKVALAKFLLTLTDKSLLEDERLSDPFVSH